MGCLCGLKDKDVQVLILAINAQLKGTLPTGERRRLEILKANLLQVEVNDGN